MVGAEVWASVAGYEGIYEVSDLGRVRSLKFGRVTILNPAIPYNLGEYAAVSLHKDGKRVRRSVHRMVADGFLGPRPSPQHQVRHLDGDHGHNRAVNLAWGTVQDNADDRKRHGRAPRGAAHPMYGRPISGEENGCAKLTDEAVREIRRQAGTVAQRRLAREYGVSQATVWKVIKGRSWDHVR